MKRIILAIFFICTIPNTLFAQQPMGFNYQAIVRNPTGELIANQMVSFQISILQGGINGDAIYSEIFVTETNEFGLVNLVIGTGELKSGAFTNINWAQSNHFIKIEVDFSGGNSYELMGSTQLLSAPFANHALTGNKGKSAYEVWLSLGNSGTEQDFINSLSGPYGSRGQSAYQVWLSLGNEGSEEDFINSLAGPKGHKGNSAYQIWLDLGNEGSEEDFINSLQGPPGTTSWDETNGSTSTSQRVGIGTNDPNGMLEVVSKSKDKDTPLFEVKNSKGQSVFVVYENNVKVVIDDNNKSEQENPGQFAVLARNKSKDVSDILSVKTNNTNIYVDTKNNKTVGGFAVSGRTSSKTDSIFFQVLPNLTQIIVDKPLNKTLGGFAVSGRTTNKALNDIFRITTDQTTIYVDNNEGKTVGGFAISGRTTNKGNADLLRITPDKTQFFLDELSKTVGGFAVSGRTSNKGVKDILQITPNETTFFVDETTDKTVGGFAISGRTTNKGDADIFRITPSLTQVFLNETGKTVGGFAISGRTTNKEGGTFDIFTVKPERTDIFLKPSTNKLLPDGFSISSVSDDDETTELFNVSEQGTVVTTKLVIAPKVTSLAPTTITQTTAESGGNVLDDGGAEISERGIIYNMGGTLNINTNFDNPSIAGIVVDGDIGTGEFSGLLIEYLQAGETYQLRAYAKNEEGLTGYGAITTFTTEAPDNLTFVLTDIITTEPILNAIITLTSLDNPYLQPVTNQAGDYEFPVSQGSYSYSISALNYVDANGEVTTSGATTIENVQMTTQLAQVTFIVKDEQENPIEFVDIILFDDTDNFYDSKTTDTNGTAIFDVSPGDYTFIVEAYDGHFEDYGVGSFSVVADEEKTIDIVLVELPKFTVTFEVTNEFGFPSVGAEVELYTDYMGQGKDEKSGFMDLGITDDNGIVVFENVPQYNNYLYYVYHPTDGDIFTEEVFDISDNITIPIAFLPNLQLGSVTDIDGNSYTTVIIGTQHWMAENLRVTNFSNNDEITSELIDGDWINATEGAYAIYPHGNIDGLGSDAEVTEAYGILYNGYAVEDPRGLCPIGWRVPTDAEWSELFTYLVNNYNQIESSNYGNFLKSIRQVDSPLTEGNTSEHPRWNQDNNHYGTDYLGFSALPAGLRSFETGVYMNIGQTAIHWTSTSGPDFGLWVRNIENNFGGVYKFDANRHNGYSIRCIEGGLPPILSTIEVENISSFTAVSGGTITSNGGYPVEQVGVVWSTQPNPTLIENDGFTEDFDGGNFEFASTLINLQPSTTYYVRAYATNSEGTGYGDEFEFETEPLKVYIVGSATSANWDNTAAIPMVDKGEGVFEIDIELIGGFSLKFLNKLGQWAPQWGTDELGDSQSGNLVFRQTEDVQDPLVIPGPDAGLYKVIADIENLLYEIVLITSTTVTDYDNNTYYTVLIGDQEWMTENLRVTHYNDGTPIPTGLNDTQWTETTEGAYAIYPHEQIDGLESESEVVNAYGLHYNWYAVNDARGLCPTGWRVPTDTDWSDLVNYIESVDNVNNGNQLKTCRQVDSPLGGYCNTTEHPRFNSHATHYGNNFFGFSGTPAGYRFYENGAFENVGNVGVFWASDRWVRTLDYNFGGLFTFEASELNGYAVRCIKE